MRRARFTAIVNLFLIVLAFLVMSPIIAVAQETMFDHPKVETGSAGLTLGTPGLFNLNLTKFGTGNWGYSIAGGYVTTEDSEHWGGFQVGAVRKLGQSAHHYSGAHFFVGYIDIEEIDDEDVAAPFVGVGGLIKWRILYGEISMMYGNWEEELGNPLLGFQLGFAIITFH